MFEVMKEQSQSVRRERGDTCTCGQIEQYYACSVYHYYTHTQLITQQLFEAALKLLQDEDFCTVSSGTIRLST